MRKFILIFSILILAAALTAAGCWVFRARLAARTLSQELNHVPVKIASLEIGQGKTQISKLWIGNPSRSKTPTSFTAEAIEIDATLKEIRGNPLTIDAILMDTIFVGIEVYSGNENNWHKILTQHNKIKKSSRDYLIRKLTLRNLTVQMTQADGSVKTYPTIPEMQFTNISSETGFPIEEIEKAIFNLMLKEILKKYGLQQLHDTLDTVVPGGSPLKYLFK